MSTHQICRPILKVAHSLILLQKWPVACNRKFINPSEAFDLRSQPGIFAIFYWSHLSTWTCLFLGLLPFLAVLIETRKEICRYRLVYCWDSVEFRSDCVDDGCIKGIQWSSLLSIVHDIRVCSICSEIRTDTRPHLTPRTFSESVCNLESGPTITRL